MKRHLHLEFLKKSLLSVGVFALMLGQAHAALSNNQQEQKGEQKGEQKAEQKSEQKSEQKAEQKNEQKGEQKGGDSKNHEQKGEQKGEQKASTKGLKSLYRLKGLRPHHGDQKGASTKDKAFR